MNHECECAIMAEDWIDTAHSKGLLCDFTLTSDQIISVPVGFWVSERVEPEISWQVARGALEGNWFEAQKQVQRPSTCPTTWGGASGSNRMNVDQAIGPIFILLVFFAIALLVKFGEFVYQLRELRQSEETDASEDSEAMSSRPSYIK